MRPAPPVAALPAAPVPWQRYATAHYDALQRLRDGRFGAGDRFPPVLPLVIYTGRTPWRAAPGLIDLVTPPAAPRSPDVRSRRSRLFVGGDFLPLFRFRHIWH